MSHCGTLKCEMPLYVKRQLNVKNISTLNVKIDAICNFFLSKCDKIRLSKCIKHFDFKCLKIDAICVNFILLLFVKICFLFTISVN